MDATTLSLLEAVRSNLNSLPIGSAEGITALKTATKKLDELFKHIDGLSAELPDLNESVTLTAPESITSTEDVRQEEAPE